jgi:hypothetical protein
MDDTSNLQSIFPKIMIIFLHNLIKPGNFEKTVRLLPTMESIDEASQTLP